MILTKRQLGASGEDSALDYLQQQGLMLIERNYQCRFGEIDLIMRDQDYLVFIEVRHRKNLGYGHPLESITPTKQKRLKKTADFFYCQHRATTELPARFDVFIPPNNGMDNDPEKYARACIWIKNAF